MVSYQNSSRIDTLKLKTMIIRKIGHLRAEKYFDHLSRLFTLKLSKCEFDKLCFRTIGRENIPIHNRLIRSIIKNACLAKVPPAKGSNRSGSTLNVHQKNDLQSLCGDAFPSSPRKARSPVHRDRKFRDRRNPLVTLGKPQSFACEDPVFKAEEQESPTELLSLGSRPPIEVASVEEGEEVEQVAGSPGVQSRSPVTAPLGIYVCGARKALSNVSACNSYNLMTCQNNGELPDTRTLRNRLEQKLAREGISISMDCVNLLNNGLDAYLRRLIEPCLGLTGSRSGNEYMRPLNGLLVPLLNGMLAGKCTQKSAKHDVSVSSLDFRVAMEMNPQLLGEDWPIQLERISLHACKD